MNQTISKLNSKSNQDLSVEKDACAIHILSTHPIVCCELRTYPNVACFPLLFSAMVRGSDDFPVSQWVASEQWRLEKVERCTKCGVIAIEKAGARPMRLG